MVGISCMITFRQQVSLFYCYWVLCKPTRWYILSLDGLCSHKDTLVLSTPPPSGTPPFSLPPLLPSLILFLQQKNRAVEVERQVRIGRNILEEVGFRREAHAL
uniref:Putative ovule protein n=1 Tax=Solanum chacoense TaxID=4108 RepID=A0A0V0HB01_SOLCH